MNDKGWIKVRMIAWSIVAVLLVIILIIGLNGWGETVFSNNIFTRGFTTSSKKVVKELKFDDINDIENIKIGFNTSDLIISENSEDNIKLIVKSNRKLKDKKYIKAEINSNTLNVEDYNNKSNRNIFNMFNNYYLEVEIKIPKDYKESITVDNRVGDVEIDSSLSLSRLDINIQTGDIEGNGKINSKEITISSKVGEVEFKSLEGKNIIIKNKTGDIDIDEFSGNGSIESQIGDIACDVERLNGDFSIKSKTGDVDLYVNRDLSFVFEGNKSFGDIDSGLEFNNVTQSSNFFKGEYGNNPVNKITTNVKTGDISIND